ncbi:MAG: DUF4835 family protein [Cyclobacteriaceae bacterium]|nr:DUF4835 family protein [Cyclobacteriaceae bacterium]
MCRGWVFSLLLLVNISHLYGQELNCVVKVDDQRAQTSDRAVFRDMEESFARFLNNRKWTSDDYTPQERIQCNLSITIEKMPAVGVFQATAQIQSVRPVYNTNYTSLMFNFADRDWQFQYIESTPLDFGDNVFTSSLASMLAFYAYVIIGIDNDSFAEFGGDAQFKKALDIVNLAQQSESGGWQAFESNRNRYWLSENFTNQDLRPVRKGLYTYHRLALDIFETKPDEARVLIVNVLKDIQAANKRIPNSILKISFFDAKKNELVRIFERGNPATRREAYNILVDLNPTNTENYKSIIGN